MDEFKTMLSTYAVLRKSNQEGSVSISTLPDKVQPALKIFDQDGDGTVDPKELMRAAELYQASKKSQKRMRKFIIGMVLFIIALIGINSAMTFMMVELGKETKASPDGVMRVNAGGGNQGRCREDRRQRGTGTAHICSSGLRLRGTQAVRDQVRERRVPLAHGPRLVPHPRRPRGPRRATSSRSSPMPDLSSSTEPR